jgi:hypothetical protein
MTAVIASETKQSSKQKNYWIASSLPLPCANAPRLSQAMTPASGQARA